MNALPPVDIALSVRIVPRGYHRAVEAKAEGMGRARRDGDDVTPATNAALPVNVVPDREDPPVGEKADGVVASRSNHDDVPPLADVTVI